MAWFGRSASAPQQQALRDEATLTAFLDQQALRLSQRIVDIYAELRSEIPWNALLADPQFAAARERAAWQAYPPGLTVVAETTIAALAPEPGPGRAAAVAGVTRLALACFDGRGVPASVGSRTWYAGRADMERWLKAAGPRLRRPDGIAEDFAGLLLAMMPIHPRLGADNYYALRDHLTIMLTDIMSEIAGKADTKVLTAALAQRAATDAAAADDPDDIFERS